MNVGVEKRHLRNQIKEEKKRMSLKNRLFESQQVFQKVELTEAFQKAEHVLCYWSLPDELSTQDFIRKWFRSKNIYLPRITNGRIEVVLYSGESSMRKGEFGILESEGEALVDLSLIDMVIVPGVAFTLKGERMGRGGGYYDRLLPSMPLSIKMGVGYKCQLRDHIPVQIHDVLMDMVITGG